MYVTQEAIEVLAVCLSGQRGMMILLLGSAHQQLRCSRWTMKRCGGGYSARGVLEIRNAGLGRRKNAAAAAQRNAAELPENCPEQFYSFLSPYINSCKSPEQFYSFLSPYINSCNAAAPEPQISISQIQTNCNRCSAKALHLLLTFPCASGRRRDCRYTDPRSRNC